jgi:hypothetical protein
MILKKPFENTSCNSQTQELAAIHEELAAIHQRLEKMGKEEPP